MSNTLKRFVDLSPEKRTILLRKLQQQQGTKPFGSTIPKASREQPLPLSFAQQRLWFLAQMEPENPFYNIPSALRFSGSFNIKAFTNALNELVRRHEILRTRFISSNGQPIQVIVPEMPIVLPMDDLSDLPYAIQEKQLKERLAQEAKRPFNLEQESLIRVYLLRLSEQEHVFSLVVHHIVADGWSMGVLVHELAILYDAFVQGNPSPLPELPVQYVDYAIWQQQQLQGEKSEIQLAYWKHQLDGTLPILDLATDRPRPPMQTFNGAIESHTLPPSLLEAATDFSRREGVTLFMTLLAVLNVLLHRYTGQTDLLVGTDIANRSPSELEPLIGFFINTLVLRTNVTDDPSFRTLLQQVRDVSLTAYTHQDVPFEKVVETLQPARNLSHPPVFQVMFSLRNLPLHNWQTPDLTTKPILVHTGTCKFDMEFTLVEMGDGQALSVEYNTDLFLPETMSRLLTHLQVLLTAAISQPDDPISQLPILTAAEQEMLSVTWNDTAVSFPQEQCFSQLFEEQVRRTPNAIAAVYQSTHITYHELNAQSNHLAAILQEHGIKPNSVVSLFSARSIHFLTAVLAVFKAGGAYLPLDPLHPAQRLAQVLQQSKSPFILASRVLEKDLQAALTHIPPAQQPEVIILEEVLTGVGRDNLPSTSQPDDLAYVIYTSGSTGVPKGAMVEQVGMVNHLYAKIHDLALTANDIIAQTASQCFDISVWQFLAALLTGGRVYIYPDDITHDPAALLQQISTDRVTIWETVPSMMRLLLEETSSSKATEAPKLSTLRWMIPTGEALSPVLCREWFAVYPQIPLLNAYGPTECSDDVTHYPIYEPPPPYVMHMPIGRPIMNMHAYVVDKNMTLVPIGVRGELCIGGIGVGRGYLHDPQRTVAAFRQNPFMSTGNKRLYKTGDLVRYLPNGTLEFIGRIDHQVKIRGFRIELGEIETILRQHDSIQEVIVTAKEDALGGKKLVAYIIPNTISPEASLTTEQVMNWQSVWDDVYDLNTLENTSQFEASGWNSSYTNQPISEEEMQEWFDHTIARILALQPTHVLEIGCGSGMLLFEIAPHVVHYYGTDFVQEPLDYIQKQLAKRPLPHVQIERREGKALDHLPAHTFNTVILNSVVQYFPSVDYLLQVLTEAVRITRPGGAIFIGDVRNLLLLQMFHLSVQVYGADPTMTKAYLQQHIQTSLAKENELLIDPAFFIALQQHIPAICDVQILLKPGKAQNELTKFRYDVILHLAAEQDRYPDLQPEHLNWQTQELTLDKLDQILKEQQPEALLIDGIPNGRLHTETIAAQWLKTAVPHDMITVCYKQIANSQTNGVDPDSFRQISDRHDYKVEIRWNTTDSTGQYQVLLRQNNLNTRVIISQTTTKRPWHQYANNPTQLAANHILESTLRTSLKEKLPTYMIPTTFVIMESFPLTPNGKIDRRALPDPEQNHVELPTTYVPPRNLLELQLSQIWERVLNNHRIGVKDNFFEIGGHSLLAARLVSQTQETLHVRLPLSSLFAGPTIAEMAVLIGQQNELKTWQGPLVKVQANGHKRPIFCVHPAGGNVLCYYEMAQHMGQDRPFYGIEAVGLGGIEKMPDQMDALAARYIAAMKEVQPQGPYLLGGWCSGGLVAHAMAQQLLSQTEQVSLLALIDTSSQQEPLPDDLPLIQDEAGFFVATLRGSGHEITEDGLEGLTVEEKLAYLLQQAKALNAVPNDVTLDYMQTYLQVYEANIRAESSYRIAPYMGKTILFRAQEHPTDEAIDLGWGQWITGDLQVIHVPGNHNSMIEDRKNARILGIRFREAIESMN